MAPRKKTSGDRYDYLADFGSPLVDDKFLELDHDWKTLFPLPPALQDNLTTSTVGDNSETVRRGDGLSGAPPTEDAADCDRAVHDEEDLDEDGGDEDCDFDGISPRMACVLDWAGRGVVSEITVLHDVIEMQLPPLARPYYIRPNWRAAFAECAKRLVSRLRLGKVPKANCTGEEMAFHLIVQRAEILLEEDYELQELLDSLPVARRELDDDFIRMTETALEDSDVLMLFDANLAARLLQPGNVVARMMDIANLDPHDWFKPFYPDRMNNHLPATQGQYAAGRAGLLQMQQLQP